MDAERPKRRNRCPSLLSLLTRDHDWGRILPAPTPGINALEVEDCGENATKYLNPTSRHQG